MNDKLCTNVRCSFSSLLLHLYYTNNDYWCCYTTLDDLLFIFWGWAVNIRIISDWRVKLKKKTEMGFKSTKA